VKKSLQSMQQCDICNVKQVEIKYIFLFCVVMYGDGKHTYTRNVGSYNDDDLRMFWFQALFTKKTVTHYVETSRVRPAVRL
jgi:hypothetical protein